MDEPTREFVRKRASQCCEYCRLPQSAVFSRFHIEHVIAIQHRGGSDVGNLALAYGYCNAFKGPNLTSIDPETGNLTRLFNPRRDVWHEHFVLVGAELIGRSEIGRATVILLQMNEGDRLELRQELLENNEFNALDE